MKPLNDSVIIKDLSQEERTTAAGVIVPEAKSPKSKRPGEIIEVGKGHMNMDGSFTPLIVEKGDKVIFKYANGNDIEVDGEMFNVCTEDHIVVITEYGPVKRDHKC